MPEEQLWQLNWQLAHPPLADAPVNRHMGLLAVAHLAARHGIKVVLGLPPGGGTTAEVHLPVALISQDTERGGWPGPAGEVLRARASGRAGSVAAAADPRPPLPRFAAGPEFPMGAEVARPDAAPLTLGAPLPPPAPATSSPVTMPEPPGAGLGGALPIFESVESDYLHARGGGPLRPSEPQASLTSAGLPQRIPQANLVPGAAVDRETRQATAAEAAQIARSRLASFQRGSRRARAMARMDRDATQPAQDD